MPAWGDDDLLVEDPAARHLADLLPQQGRPGGPGVPDPHRAVAAPPRMPEPRTSHNISNVEVIERRGDLVDVRFNWHTMYYRYKTVDPYYGTTFYTIDFSGHSAADPTQERGPQERLHPPRRRHLPLLGSSDRHDTHTRSRSASRTGSPGSSGAGEDQTVADASYRAAYQHPAGLPRRRLRHVQGVLRVRRVTTGAPTSTTRSRRTRPRTGSCCRAA